MTFRIKVMKTAIFGYFGQFRSGAFDRNGLKAHPCFEKALFLAIVTEFCPFRFSQPRYEGPNLLALLPVLLDIVARTSSFQHTYQSGQPRSTPLFDVHFSIWPFPVSKSGKIPKIHIVHTNTFSFQPFLKHVSRKKISLSPNYKYFFLKNTLAIAEQVRL